MRLRFTRLGYVAWSLEHIGLKEAALHEVQDLKRIVGARTGITFCGADDSQEATSALAFPPVRYGFMPSFCLSTGIGNLDFWRL